MLLCYIIQELIYQWDGDTVYLQVPRAGSSDQRGSQRKGRLSSLSIYLFLYIYLVYLSIYLYLFSISIYLSIFSTIQTNTNDDHADEIDGDADQRKGRLSLFLKKTPRENKKRINTGDKLLSNENQW